MSGVVLYVHPLTPLFLLWRLTKIHNMKFNQIWTLIMLKYSLHEVHLKNQRDILLKIEEKKTAVKS